MTARAVTHAARTGDEARATYDSQAASVGEVVRASTGRVLAAWGVNLGASTRYIQLFASDTLPADAVAPSIAPIPVPAGQAFSLDLAAIGGAYFPGGIAWCSSTTAETKTVTGSADVWMTMIHEGA